MTTSSCTQAAILPSEQPSHCVIFSFHTPRPIPSSSHPLRLQLPGEPTLRRCHDLCSQTPLLQSCVLGRDGWAIIIIHSNDEGDDVCHVLTQLCWNISGACWPTSCIFFCYWKHMSHLSNEKYALRSSMVSVPPLSSSHRSCLVAMGYSSSPTEVHVGPVRRPPELRVPPCTG